jgi:hypothetical protein
MIDAEEHTTIHDLTDDPTIIEAVTWCRTCGWPNGDSLADLIETLTEQRNNALKQLRNGQG